MTQQLETIAANFASLGFDGRTSIRFKFKENKYQFKLARDGETSLDVKVKYGDITQVKYKQDELKRADKFSGERLVKMKQTDDGDEKGSQLRFRIDENAYRHEIGKLKFEEVLYDLSGDTFQIILGPAPGKVSDTAKQVCTFLKAQDFSGFKKKSVKIQQNGNVVTIQALGTRVEITV